MPFPARVKTSALTPARSLRLLLTLTAGTMAFVPLPALASEKVTGQSGAGSQDKQTSHPLREQAQLRQQPREAVQSTSEKHRLSPSVTSKRDALDVGAGQKASPAETIFVTGTRLTQSRLTNVMAGSSLSGEQIGRRGYTDLGLALLRENPAVSVPDNSSLGTQNMFGAGQSFVSLLNLGSQRTLTLVDGMRMGGGATASIYGVGSGSQVDVSTLPTSLIKSVDTRLGGAGAAYGADAVAGVINYTLDDHYKGVSLDGQGGWTQQLDAASEKIAFKAGTGFDHDKGGLVFDVEYRNQAGIVASDRPDVFGANAAVYHRPALGEASPYTYVLSPDLRFIQASLTGMPSLTGAYGDVPVYGGNYSATWAGLAASGIANVSGIPLIFSQNGQSLVPLNAGTLLKGDTAQAVGGDGISLRNYNQIVTPNDKLNLTLLGHYDFDPHIHARWQGWYARGSAENQVGQGTWSSTLFNDALTANNAGPYSSSYYQYGVTTGAYALSTSNPFLTSAEQSTIKQALAENGLPTDTFYLNRLNQDLDQGLFRTTSQMFRFQGGLNGDFRAFNRQFNWKLQGEYTRNTNATTAPSLVIPNLVNALNAVTAADGTIECAPGYQNAPIATRSAVCAPLNPFGYNQMTPAARDYVTTESRSTNRNTQRDLQAEISSTVATLPAGAIRWDLGYEHRREAYHFDPGAYLLGWKQGDGSYLPYGNSASIPYTGGAYHTHEGFGELDIPLISPAMHLPGAYHLSLTANGRVTYNSITGTYWTYMTGAAWWLTRDIGLSGNYAVSVRNPGIGELYSPQSSTYQNGVDPCSDTGLASGPNPALRAANCARAGLPQNFVSNFNSYGIEGTAGGNRNLSNERSKSYTGSLEFRPHFIRGFDVKASFVDVRVSDAITYLSANDLLNACYDTGIYPNNRFCSTFTRDSSGQISSFRSGYYNIASYETQALQTTIEYNTPLSRLGLPESSGAIDLRGNYVHYVKSARNYAGSTYLLSGNIAAPNDNFTLNTTWIRGPFNAQWQTIWYGPSLVALQVPTTRYEGNKRPAFAYFNLSLDYAVTEHFSTSFVVNNITDALPRDAGIYSVGRYYEALIGRAFQMRIGAHF
ncbi:TonB-dependent receptor [Asaia bogorensis]|uniref:TonB-dependent receptor n=2 Tax=Asaia TaxID=91914 RepID=UPI00068F92F4|nr:TonB-dependent receptor [Asaia bogorensis]